MDRAWWIFAGSLDTGRAVVVSKNTYAHRIAKLKQGRLAEVSSSLVELANAIDQACELLNRAGNYIEGNEGVTTRLTVQIDEFLKRWGE